MGKPLFKIKKEDFDNFPFDSAMVLSQFDITGEQPVLDEHVITMTTGDVTVSCIPRLVDAGEDVNGCPPGLAELQQVIGWDCKASYTALTASPQVIADAVGIADVAGNKVSPRGEVKISDFHDRWIVGAKMGGGVIAAHIKRAMSTGGMTLKTTKNGKGQISVELTGHPSIDDEDPTVPPIDFYSTVPGV